MKSLDLIHRFDLLLFPFLNVIRQVVYSVNLCFSRHSPKATESRVQTSKSAICWLKTEVHIVQRQKGNSFDQIKWTWWWHALKYFCDSLFMCYKPSRSPCRGLMWPRPAAELWACGPELERSLSFASVLQTAERPYLQLECCISEGILHMYIDDENTVFIDGLEHNII